LPYLKSDRLLDFSGQQDLSSFLNRGVLLGDFNLPCPDEVAVRPQEKAAEHWRSIFIQPQGRGQQGRPRENTP
jgi:hypothetical protein